MRAIRVHNYGLAPRLERIADPKIREPHDVLIDVGAAGLCRTDIHIIEGQWASRSGVTLPYTLGHENAGTVRAVGSAVTNVAPGDVVICHPLVTCGLCRACRLGDDVHCVDSRFPGIDSDGGMAELLLSNARSVVKLDTNCEPAEVAALADAGLTAYHAAKKASKLLRPGDHVVAIGAGGLGHIGVQCLKALTPATLIVVDRSDHALELAASFGADHTLRADGTEVSRTREISSGGAQIVIDFVGEAGTEDSGLQMLRRSGSYFVVGYGGRVQVPTIDVIASEINIVGNLVGSYADLTELMSLVHAGSVSVQVTRYPLSAFGDAVEDLEAGRLVGRGVLVPALG